MDLSVRQEHDFMENIAGKGLDLYPVGAIEQRQSHEPPACKGKQSSKAGEEA